MNHTSVLREGHENVQLQAANTNHQRGVNVRKRFDGGAKHCSAIDESLHDEVSHCFMGEETRKQILKDRKTKRKDL